ncbi:MAG TPA: hypothetical protein VHE34_26580 [Puia sp.]|uniref:hypothetical protein n=1 Tax=Puia sp. TaxID=2045100 RepID=UPI002CFA8D3D|nr:hypothetical protein [Puia sp.]HVU98828.1 hypothetical protein [Puia sp.]
MKKNLLLLAITAFLFSGAAFAQTGKGAQKAKKDSTAATKKPMPKSCPGKVCGKKS